jgi:CBS domain containing-hemolysin-like protein
VLEILNTSVQLVTTLLTLLAEVGALALRYALLIVWIAWWLWGVNWAKAWGVLAKGGWVVVVLLTVVAALSWAALAPSNVYLLGLFPIANFWWQLGAVTLIVLLALFCGWLQGVFGWAPAEIELAPAVEAHGHADHGGHGH